MFFVYIVECSDRTFYTGATNNLDKRVFEHNNSKKGAHYTKIRRPVKLVYFEEFATFQESRKREVLIKKMDRKQKLLLINKAF